jgi:hypothetical protein
MGQWSLTRRSPGSNVPCEEFANLNICSAGCDHRVAPSERTDLLLVITFDHAESPRPAPIEHWAENHHATRFDHRLPVGSMKSHDLALLLCHVEGKGRTRSLEPEHEGTHVFNSTRPGLVECPRTPGPRAEAAGANTPIPPTLEQTYRSSVPSGRWGWALIRSLIILTLAAATVRRAQGPLG